MKKLYYLFIIALLFTSSHAFGQNPGDVDYIYHIPSILIDKDSSAKCTLYAYARFKNTIDFRIDWGELVFSKKLSENEFAEIELPLDLIKKNFRVYDEISQKIPQSSKGYYNFFIATNINVLVFVKIQTKFITFFAEPTHADGESVFSNIGKFYKITSYKNPNSKNTANSFPFVNLNGAYDRTKLSFFVGGDISTEIKWRDGKIYKYGELIQDSLNRSDNITIIGNGENTDLGGCMVMANKPISVYSGNTYSSINEQRTNPNLLYSKEKPIYTPGRKFYIPALRNSGNKPILRITAKDSANVYAGDSLIGKIKYQFGMKDSAWIEYKIEENNPLTIWSDRAIQVMSYSTGILGNKINNPIQMDISSSDSYYYANLMYVPEFKTTDQKDFATFIIESDTSGNLPNNMKFEITKKDSSTINRTLNDFELINLQEIYDPDLKDTKMKVYTFSIELAKNTAYLIRSKTKFQIYVDGFNDDFNYMYNKEESFMYLDLERPDTLCPEPHYRLNGSGKCYRAETYVVDRPQDDDEVRTNMAIIYFDKKNSYNFEFHNDDFVPGEKDSINWTVDVMDMSLDARAVITFTDRAGNDTTIIVEYKARKMKVTPSLHNFGYVPVGESKTQKFTMTNNADFDFLFRTISFGGYPYLHERKGFKLNFLFDTTKVIPPTQTVEFEVTFAPKELGVFRDTLYLSDTTCYSDMKLVVAGNSDGTSVRESEEGIFITPNPATDYIIVTSGNYTLKGVVEDKGIEIYNIFGECVLSVETGLRPVSTKIDVSALPAGVYILRAGSGVYKFMIVR